MKLRYIIIAVALLLVAAGGLFFLFKKQRSTVCKEEILDTADTPAYTEETVAAEATQHNVDIEVDDIPVFTPLAKLVASRQRTTH